MADSHVIERRGMGTSLRTKYLVVATLCALLSLAAVAGIVVYQNWSTYAGIGRVLDDSTNQRVGEELRLRAAAVAEQLAAAVAAPTLALDQAAVERLGNEFVTEATIVRLSVRDLAGQELFAFKRDDEPVDQLTRSALRPVRVQASSLLGGGPQSVGEVEVTVRANADSHDFYQQVHDVALDCVNQGGIAHVQTISPSRE